VETIKRQAETIAGLREDRGRLTAELSSAQARQGDLERERGRFVAERDAAQTRYDAILVAQTAAPASYASAPWWRTLCPWLAVLGAGVVAVALLAWPR